MLGGKGQPFQGLATVVFIQKVMPQSNYHNFLVNPGLLVDCGAKPGAAERHQTTDHRQQDQTDGHGAAGPGER